MLYDITTFQVTEASNDISTEPERFSITSFLFTSKPELRKRLEIVVNCSDEHTFCNRNEDLTEIPKNIPKDTTTLDLSGNNIENVTPKSHPNVTSLSLSENSVTNIEPGSLDNLTEIKNLELDGNSLRYIPSGLFKNQAKLENLDLGENSLQNISGDMWEGLTSVQDLRLTGNKFINIGPGAFSNLPQLNTLYVSTQTFTTFNLLLLSPSTYPDTKKTPKLAVEEARTLVCDKTLCELRKIGDEAVRVLFTLNGSETRPKCSNLPVYWDEMECPESGKIFDILEVNDWLPHSVNTSILSVGM